MDEQPQPQNRFATVVQIVVWTLCAQGVLGMLLAFALVLLGKDQAAVMVFASLAGNGFSAVTALLVNTQQTKKPTEPVP